MTRWLLYRFSPWLLFWLVLLGLLIGMMTETGLQLMWSVVAKRLPEGLSVERVEGRIGDEIRLRNIRIEQQGNRIDIGRVAVRWRPEALLTGRIWLQHIILRDIRYQLADKAADEPEAAASTLSFSLPSLPRISIDQFDVADVHAGDRPQLLRLIASLEHRSGQVAVELSRLDWVNAPRVRAQMNAQLLPKRVQGLELVVQSTAGGEIQLGGHLDWEGAFRARADFDVRELNLVPFQHQLPANLNGRGELRLEDHQQPRIRLSALQLRAEWPQNPQALVLSSSGIDWEAGDLRIATTDLKMGANRAQLKGRLHERWQMDARIDAPDLALVHPQLAGAASINIGLRGKRQEPSLEIKAAIDELRAINLQLQQAKLSGALHLGAHLQTDLKVDLLELRTPWLVVNNARMQLAGPREALKIGLKAAGQEFKLQSQATANLSRLPDARLRLQNIRLSSTELGRWDLVKSGPIQRQADSIQVAVHCLQSGSARLCLGGNSQPASSQGQIELVGFELQRLANLYAPAIQVTGEVSAAARINRDDNGLQASATVNNSEIRVSTERDDEELVLLQLEDGRGELDYSLNAIRASLDIPAADGSGISASLRSDQDGNVQVGEAKLLLRDLELLTLLSPEVVSAKGEIQGAASVRGSLRSPDLGLELNLSNGAFLLNTPQIELVQTNISATGDLEQINLLATAQSGDGNLRVQGQIQPKLGSGKVQAQGQNFEVLDSELARVLISPELKLEIQPDQLDLRGRVDIPFADIHPRSIDSGNQAFVAPSADEIILRDENPTRQGPALRSRIRVVLGSDVRFDGFGLKSDLAGDVRVSVDPGQLPSAQGKLALVDGVYKAYGQDLKIDQGEVIFSGGAIDDPGIDLRASRKPTPDIMVGINARGRAREPRISLWSNPDMSQTEQLSWLVLGRSGQATSEEDQASLNNAALALGLKGSDFLAKRFKGKLGLDELSIGARPGQESQQAALVLGKYLNPRLYVSYGIGLFEPIYTFRMRYELSSRWTLQSESGVESGGDIVYTIER